MCLTIVIDLSHRLSSVTDKVGNLSQESKINKMVYLVINITSKTKHMFLLQQCYDENSSYYVCYRLVFVASA